LSTFTVTVTAIAVLPTLRMARFADGRAEQSGGVLMVCSNYYR